MSDSKGVPVSQRLQSLDVFRGMTIALMILVNMAGVADHVYWPLDHAAWHGWTPTDLVFPFFLFAVGMSLPYSFLKYLENGADRTPLYARILKRAAILFGIGVAINGFNGLHAYDFSTIRIMGVLQRIALAYLGSSAIVLFVKKNARFAAAAAILVGYWAAMTFLPVPGHGAGVLTREGNFGSYIDRLLIPAAHLYRGDGWKNIGDPEGLFSTLPAIVSALIGFFCRRLAAQAPSQRRDREETALCRTCPHGRGLAVEPGISNQ